MKYSIVIPCFNEEGTIQLILERTKKIFSSLGFDDIVVSKHLNRINRVVAGKWTK